MSQQKIQSNVTIAPQSQAYGPPPSQAQAYGPPPPQQQGQPQFFQAQPHQQGQYPPPQQQSYGQIPPQGQYPPPQQQSYGQIPPQGHYPPQFYNQQQLYGQIPHPPPPPQIYQPYQAVIGNNLEIPPGSIYRSPSGSAQVLLKINSARNLISADINGYSDPYVKILIPSVKKNQKTKVIQKNLNPNWSEQFTLEIFNPQHDLIILECRDKDTLGKDDYIGYCAIDVSKLPRGIEVSTNEPLSFVPHGEIQISLTALNFGVDNYPANYIFDYTNWRYNLPTVSKKGSIKSKLKDSGNKSKKSKPVKESGPYISKVVSTGYCVVNGFVKTGKASDHSSSSNKGSGGSGSSAFDKISSVVGFLSDVSSLVSDE